MCCTVGVIFNLYNFLGGDEVFHHAILSSRVQSEGTEVYRYFFPSWHLRMKLIPRRIVFVLFFSLLASMSVSHPMFFSIFAAHTLSPEVENLK